MQIEVYNLLVYKTGVVLCSLWWWNQ